MFESVLWLSLVELYTLIKSTVAFADSNLKISNSTKSNPNSTGSFQAIEISSDVADSKVKVGVIGKDKFGAPGTWFAAMLVSDMTPAFDELTGILMV